MIKNDFMNPRNSLVLFGLNKEFDFLVDLYDTNKFPKSLMISGPKGSGKFTLINHLLNYIYDKNNYTLKERIINKDTIFYKQYLNEVFSNIIYLSGDYFKNTKIEEIRLLKSTILKSSLSNLKRFIIFDDVELFNTNCLNALLKIIEEPVSNNYFILIDNQKKPLIKTVQSRALKFKVFLNQMSKKKIIESLLKFYKINPYINYDNGNLTPGNYLLFNYVCENNKIDLDNNYQLNLETILNLFKKTKDNKYINLSMYLTDYYFNKLSKSKNNRLEKIVEDRSFIISNLNKFVLYNLNQKSLINAINSKLSNE